MNSYWIQKSLEFHGLPLKSIWDGERGDEDLVQLGLTNIDYTTYRHRSKNLGFAERGVRLKLHQFIAKNASTLFDQLLVDSVSSSCVDLLTQRQPREDFPVINKAPPFECFLPHLPIQRCERVFNVSGNGNYNLKNKI